LTGTTVYATAVGDTPAVVGVPVTCPVRSEKARPCGSGEESRKLLADLEQLCGVIVGIGSPTTKW
jgi:hypothetical protein